MGWFGIRGIGSLYYLTYALNHADLGAERLPLLRRARGRVAGSVLVHGATAQPLLSRYERRSTRRD